MAKWFIISGLFVAVFLRACPTLGQKKSGELIPIIKHSYKIDSLLTQLIAEGSPFSSKDSYIVIHIDQRDSMLFFSVDSFDKMELNRSLAWVYLHQEHSGFFELAGYKVFAIATSPFSILFSPTKRVKWIDFLDFRHVAPMPDPPIIKVLAFYRYRSGKVKSDLNPQY